jgi:hypothetical protein
MSSFVRVDGRHRSGPPTPLEVRGGDVSDVPSARGFVGGESHSPPAPMRVGRAEHQILYAYQQDENRFTRAPSKARVARRPYPDDGQRVARGCIASGYAFRSAPAGTAPVSTYRHSAMITRRAKATIPMRRVTAPPPPKRC